MWKREALWIELHPFHDQRLNCDLAAACVRVDTAKLGLPYERHIIFTMGTTQDLKLDAYKQRVA